MKGSVRKRGKTWSYYFDLGKIDGKRQKKEKGGFATKKEAEAALAKALNEYNTAGLVFEPSEITVADYLNQWFDLYCKANLKYNTQVGYLHIIQGHLIPKFGAFILTLDEWKRIIDRFPPESRYHIPLMVGFYTGLRISEAFALTWDDIDFDSRTLSVNKQIVKRNFGADVRKAVEKKGKKEQRSSWYFTTPKTLSSNRTVKFGETLYKALKAEKNRQAKNEIKYGEYYTIHVIKPETDEKGNEMKRIVPVQKCIDSPLQRVRMICVAENGQYTSTDSFKFCSRVIHKELLLAFDYHSLRHTHATLLIENGADVKDVQTRLGHTNIETTLQTYVHDTEKMVERSVELFEQIAQARTS